MDDLISRQAAINAMAELQGRASSKSELTGISKAWKKIKQLPSAQPDLDSAYTEGYTQAEAKYRKMWDEMQAAKQDVVEDAWDMFQMISSAWYGKVCYSKQDDGSVYSRLSCKYMTFDDAVREFMEEIDDD